MVMRGSLADLKAILRPGAGEGKPSSGDLPARRLGSMIMFAKNFLQTDTVVLGIVIIGLIGYAIELLMRWLERRLIRWRGRG